MATSLWIASTLVAAIVLYGAVTAALNNYGRPWLETFLRHEVVNSLVGVSFYGGPVVVIAAPIAVAVRRKVTWPMLTFLAVVLCIVAFLSAVGVMVLCFGLSLANV